MPNQANKTMKRLSYHEITALSDEGFSHLGKANTNKAGRTDARTDVKTGSAARRGLSFSDPSSTGTQRPLEAERLITRASLGGGTFRVINKAEFEKEHAKTPSTPKGASMAGQLRAALDRGQSSLLGGRD